ncbi:hypothetical protein H0H92_015314 [Tricholoma furcatifolium]|nr:hypothetical protein H0H92_015314 [Tricholoma furcatifolium]
MDELAPEGLITEWDESAVHLWLSSIGYPQYEAQIREHNISGDALCLLDPDAIKAVGIATIGQRLAILKAVYQLKIAHGVPIDSDHYVPPSEVSERTDNSLTVDTLYTMVKDQGPWLEKKLLRDMSIAQRISTLEEDNRTLNTTLQSLADEVHLMRNSMPRNAQFVKPQTSPTKPEQGFESPHPSPQQLEHDIPPLGRNQGPSQLGPSTNSHASTSSSEKHRPPPVSISDASGNSSPTPQTPRPRRQESSENLKSFKVTLDDPTWKVLPAALKKYRINNDNWQNYAMFICYGSPEFLMPSTPGNRIDRCLSYDEKPLLLFQKLKDAKKNPVFMLKHIKDIRSPIAVAQQKHAARKASSVITSESVTTSATQGHAKTSSTSRTNRPPRLEVQDLSASTPLGSSLGSSLSPQPGWPEPSILSPAVDIGTRTDDIFQPPGSAGNARESIASTASTATTSTNMSGTTAINSTNDHDFKSKTPEPVEPPLSSASISARDVPVPNNAISYAVAIYPYMAEQDDEFDVVVGDTFVILSRARGWWIVQRDPTGSGIVEPDKHGWVPAGCLLETNVPVASAIAEATAAKGGSTNGSPDTPASKTPILPLSIISTSFPGIALMDYTKKGDEELDLVKDDALRVFKRYNHWSYAVKENGGDRGWVPSWFIGKVGQPGNLPPTPNSSIPAHLHSSSDDAPQVSPMSSAFPPTQTRLNVPL